MRRLLVPLALAAVVALVVAASLFQPWRLFTDSTVNESSPIAEPVTQPTGSTPDSPPPVDAVPSTPVSPAPPQDEVLAEGTFEDAEHGTDGVAQVLQLADGRRFVRLEDLATSDGPDLHVWLTDQPSGGEWGSYDDGRYVKLGGLKANNGNQNYEIPEDVELDGFTSVVIWCDRFNVAFGTAPIRL
jgi:hypothetical protein